MRKTLLLFLAFLPLFLSAQRADSLKTALKTASAAGKPELLRLLALEYQYSDAEQSRTYSEQAVAAAKAVSDQWTEAFCLRLLGIYYDEKGDSRKAVTYIGEALALNRSIKDGYGISACLNSLGVIHFNLSRFEQALKYFLEVLPYYDEQNDMQSKAYTLMNIGGIYRYSGDKKGAISYYLQAYRLMKSSGNKKGQAITAGNLGSGYFEAGMADSAIWYMNAAIAIKRQLNDKRSLAASLSSLAMIHKQRQEYDQCVTILEECMALQREVNDKRGLAGSLVTAGEILSMSDNKKDLALPYLLEAYQLSAEVGDLFTMRTASYHVGNEYYKAGKYREAADYIFVNSQIRDSLYNQDRNQALAEMRTKYETDKKQQEIALLNQQNKMNALELARAHADQLQKEQALELLNKEAQMKAIQLEKSKAEAEASRKQNELLTLDQQVKAAQLAKEQAERGKLDEQNKKRAQQLVAVLAGSVLLLVLLLVALRGYRQKKKANLQLSEQNQIITRQKEEVQHQKELVDEKNREITDSISYAKRLQDAILPPERLWKQLLPDSFVLYLPKDIVAGDFYWLEEKNGRLLFAAADCTGHGVPGAMVSVVCSNALNRTVNEFGITEPGKILDKVRELVIGTFAKSESDVKDGMDISLCCYDPENRVMHWSGANNPLWILRREADTLEELAPDKQPIGQFEHARPFRTTTVPVEPGDIVYLLTDGFADQFGGPKGKKFKYRPLQQLLTDNARRPMPEQHDLLLRAFREWRGQLEQVDDVCLIGVRL